MSDQDQKEKHSKRLQKETNAIRKQQKIAKSYGLPDNKYEGHRFAKHHALNCGNPNCIMCSNPRKTLNEKTKQELSFEQTDKWIKE